MTDVRYQKIQNIANEIDPTSVYGKKKGDLLILSWGSTHGACKSATEQLVKEKYKVGHVSVQWINPLPRDLKKIFKNYKKVLIPEVNSGQFRKIIRSEFLIDAIGFNEVKGRPLNPSSIVGKAKELINE